MVFDQEHYVVNAIDIAVYLVQMSQLSTKAVHLELELLSPGCS
jgi:hypothetical protein